MRYLGIDDYKLLGITDGTLTNHLDCMEKIPLDVYTKIFVTGTMDGHLDHSAAYHCVINALEKQKNCKTEIYLYEVHREIMEPSHFLDITYIQEKKEQAIRLHKSQLDSVPYDRLARVTAEHRALQNRQLGKYYEVYKKIEISSDISRNTNNEIERELSKFKQFYQVLTKWMLKEKQNGLEELLKNKYGVSKCVIYGYAELGQILEKNLSGTSIPVEKILDRKISGVSYGGVEIVRPDDFYSRDITVIVTAVYYYDEIEKKLRELGYKNIYSLYEIITNL
jgi:hypothetical protein